MVPLPVGLLKVERAQLVTFSGDFLKIADPVVEVYEDAHSRRLLRGRGFIHNRSMVELLEKNDSFDIVLDFGDKIFFLLTDPLIQVGKVFDEKVFSTMHFSIGKRIEEISTARAEKLFKIRAEELY